MTKTFEQGREEVEKLCRYFETNQQAFLAPGVKEAHVRQSLIDPFFEALGWDVRNTAMAAPQYREVIPEDSLEVESMLALRQQLSSAKSEAQKDVIQRQIDCTDREIDRLVYELYGLTEEEVSIIEQNG